MDNKINEEHKHPADKSHQKDSNPTNPLTDPSLLPSEDNPINPKSDEPGQK